ncbi:D-tyrosyl-tRNA(Tyr) deacylase [Elsinoe australis]|uniref:D-aminoacyl-tRNA deacylase n=1 Tax=Elsinoe australis TaxID=40998 RepID=A0A2P7Z2E7_9PEZI|nr:D-tyrosyl-tRNA(Tyr) deacylase [Elsinoe australis]
MANKILKVKLWDADDGKKWKKNVQDIDGEILCVSQFTLLASTKKNSPDFHKAAPPGPAKELYDRFFESLQKQYKADRVKDGVFQAMMDVGIVNDGPVTIEIETNPPPMGNPASGLDLPEDATVKGKIQKQFVLPASLLE